MKFVPFEVRYPPEWIYDPSDENPRIELDWESPMHLTWAAMEKLVVESKYSISCNRIELSFSCETLFM